MSQPKYQRLTAGSPQVRGTGVFWGVRYIQGARSLSTRWAYSVSRLSLGDSASISLHRTLPGDISSSPTVITSRPAPPSIDRFLRFSSCSVQRRGEGGTPLLVEDWRRRPCLMGCIIHSSHKLGISQRRAE